MEAVSYQRAMEVLQERIGVRWEGVEGEGRDEMVRVLREALGYDKHQANEVLNAMIAAGTLRFHHASVDPSGAGPIIGGPGTTGQAGAPTVGGFAGAPASAPLLGLGYWQIGHEQSEAPGRKGQVDPT